MITKFMRTIRLTTPFQWSHDALVPDTRLPLYRGHLGTEGCQVHLVLIVVGTSEFVARV